VTELLGQYSYRVSGKSWRHVREMLETFQGNIGDISGKYWRHFRENRNTGNWGI